MPRGTAADNSVTPAEVHKLFETAARIDESQLGTRVQGASITTAFLTYFFGVLGFRLGFALHFNEDCVERDVDGKIVAITVPAHIPCDGGPDEPLCSYCQNLAKERVKDADDEEAVPEDYYNEYWGPKSEAGVRRVPVLQERGREITDLFLQERGSLVMCSETVRRRITQLGVVTEGIDPDQLTPQALRASAARYWMNWRDFDTDDLQALMGWKYLSTAKFYLPTSYAKLRDAMARCLGKDPQSPYDVNPDPPTFTEVKENNTLIHVDGMTPDVDLPHHEFADKPNPLEAEAQEYQATFDDKKFSARIPEPVSMISTWCMDLSERVTEWGTEWWNDHIPYAPLDWTLRSRWRRTAFFLAFAVPALVWLGADLAELGFRIDVWEQEVSVSREALSGFALLSYVMYNTLGDEWDQIEDDLMQFVSALRGTE